LLINEATKKIAAPPPMLNGSSTVPVPAMNGKINGNHIFAVT
jgi:hypothetical protein